MLALAAVALLAPAAEAQLRPASVAGKVTLVATVAPRMTFFDLSPVEVREQSGYAVSTRSLSVVANVPHALVVRLPHDPRSTGPAVEVEVLDLGGRWVALSRGSAVTLAEGGPGTQSHTVQCRISGAAPGTEVECPLSYELVSTHPDLPMRVTAAAGVLVAHRM